MKVRSLTHLDRIPNKFPPQTEKCETIAHSEAYNISLLLNMISKLDLSYMKMAHIWAENSTCRRKQVGSLIVKNNTIISDGFNGTVPGTSNICEDETGKTLWHVIHAEQNAICKLARNDNSALGSTMYITLSPCRECSKLILMSGIKRVVYSTRHSDMSGPDFLQANGIEVEQVLLNGIPTFDEQNDVSVIINDSSITITSKNGAVISRTTDPNVLLDYLQKLAEAIQQNKHHAN